MDRDRFSSLQTWGTVSKRRSSAAGRFSATGDSTFCGCGWRGVLRRFLFLRLAMPERISAWSCFVKLRHAWSCFRVFGISTPVLQVRGAEKFEIWEKKQAAPLTPSRPRIGVGSEA